jgi:hypothetical protein
MKAGTMPAPSRFNPLLADKYLRRDSVISAKKIPRNLQMGGLERLQYIEQRERLPRRGKPVMRGKAGLISRLALKLQDFI